MLFIYWRVGGFSVSTQTGKGRLLLIIMLSCCWISVSKSLLVLTGICCVFVGGVCLLSHFFRSWHHGFQISFLNKLIIVLIKLAAACLVSFKVLLFEVQVLGLGHELGMLGILHLIGRRYC